MTEAGRGRLPALAAQGPLSAGRTAGYWFSRSSSAGTSRSTRAGLPTTSFARRDVLRHHGAGADERLLADLDAREEDRPAADARAAADRRPLDQLVAALGRGP